MTDKERYEYYDEGYYFALKLMEGKILKRKKNAKSDLENMIYLDLLTEIDGIRENRKEVMENYMKFDDDGYLIGDN